MNDLSEIIFEKYPLPVALTDSRGAVVSCNEKFERMFGTRKNEITGKSLESIFEDETNDLFEAVLYQVWTTGEFEDMLKVKRNRGDSFPAIVRGSKIKSTKNDTLAAAFFICDYSAVYDFFGQTAEKKKEAEFWQKKEWQATGRKIIHDIKTPIATIGSAMNAVLMPIARNEEDNGILKESLSDLKEIEELAKTLLTGMAQ